MPSFQIDVEFEVFCGTCGAGLCYESDTRTSRNRQFPQVTVNACPKCIEAALERGRDEIREGELTEALDRIHELENQT